MSVGELLQREERPAYVRFEKRAIEDKQASLREGRYIAKDVDYALITPPYSKDCVEKKVTQWLADIERNHREGRIPDSWVKLWKAAYEQWRIGNDIPINGTPIKGWGLISPAQQEMLIRINCLTVEDLANVTDEGLRRIGMGGVELKMKAKNWLATLSNNGQVAMQVTALEKENAQLKIQLETLIHQVAALRGAQLKEDMVQVELHNGISASDLLEDEKTPEEQYKAKFGKPPHHRASLKTIMKALNE